MTLKLMTDEQIKAQIPVMIEAGRSPYGAAHEIGIGLKRLRRLATPEQMTALLINKDKLKHKGRAPLPRKKGLETQEGLRAAVDDAIERGLGINATFQELEITHYTLMKNITQEQEQALRANRQAKLRPRDVFDEDEQLKVSPVVKQHAFIAKPANKPTAQAIMREIIATHPRLATRF